MSKDRPHGATSKHRHTSPMSEEPKGPRPLATVTLEGRSETNPSSYINVGERAHRGENVADGVLKQNRGCSTPKRIRAAPAEDDQQAIVS
jgi:hypothetical protein